MTEYHDPIRSVCEAHGVTREDLRGDSRCKPLPAARAEYSFDAVICRGATLPIVARVLRKHHTTILSAIRSYGTRHFGTLPNASLDQIREAARWHGAQVAA